MADEKKFLDYEGLSNYHKKAKALYDETYAKKDDVKDVDLSNYVKSEDADKVYAKKDELNNYLKSTDAETNYAKKTDLATYPTSDAVDTKISEAIAKDVASTYAKKSEVVDQETLKKVIAEAQHMKKEIVEALPNASDGVANVIYLVKKGEGGETNIYDEYLLIDGKWELIGNTETKVDLSNYPTKEELKSYPTKEEMTGAIAGAKPDIGVISNKDIDMLFWVLPEQYKPYPASGFFPSPDGVVRVWQGDKLFYEGSGEEVFNTGYFSNSQITRVEYPTKLGTPPEGWVKANHFQEIVMDVDVSPFLFQSCKISVATLTKNVKKIGRHGLAINGLQVITFENDEVIIEPQAFYGNDNIEKVFISRKTIIPPQTFPDTTQIIYRD